MNMRIVSAVMVGSFCLVTGVFGQSNSAPVVTQAQVDLLKQIEETRSQFLKSDKYKGLEANARKAEKEFNEAAAGNPELKAVGKRISALLQELNELQMKKAELEKKDPVLVAKKSAQDKAWREMSDAMSLHMPSMKSVVEK